MVALVVDDDPVTRRLVRRALEGVGCSPVLEAEDGLQAQKLLEERTDVDLVLTDILMPGLDGLDLLRWGRERSPDTVWIILSGLDTFDSAVEAIRLGAFDFLAKPPRVAELEVSVRNALERRSLLVERERLHEELREANRQLMEKLEEVEEKSELLHRDLEKAEIIQRALLPADPPSADGFRVLAMYRPGQHVGGDLYDAFCIDDHTLAIYVADATGHGVTAAMLSVLFKQCLRLREPEAGRPLSPAVVLDAANRSLLDAVAAPGLFLTAVYCLIDTRSGEARVGSAGHSPLLHARAGGDVAWIGRTGPALGLTADAVYEEASLTLRSGDRLLLYTDGLLPEASEAESERLAGALRDGGGDAAELLRELVERATSELPSEDRDDVTLLLVDANEGPSRFDNGDVGAVRPRAAAGPARSPVVYYGEGEKAACLALKGRATWMHAPTFFETARAIRAADRPLVVDLSECDYLDSTFLGSVHELVDEGGVRVQNAKPEVRSLFEELGMEKVLESLEGEPEPVPELSPVAAASPDEAEGRRRILEAHEALAGINPRNRQSFAGVIESIRNQPTED